VKVGNRRLATPHNLRNDGGNNLRKKARSKKMSPQLKEIPVPDHEYERSSADDSLDRESPSGEDSEEDQGGDDTPNNGDGGRGENPSMINNRGGESFQNPRLRVEEKFSTLAYAQSFSSLRMPGAPNLKNDEDPVTYPNNINSMNDTVESFLNSEVRDEGIIQKKKRRPKLAEANSLLHFQMTNILPLSNQNKPSRLNDEHLSTNHDRYENASRSLVFWYGDKTNQIIICVVWFFIVIIVMETAREMKRGYRLQQLRRFLDHFMHETPPSTNRDSNHS